MPRAKNKVFKSSFDDIKVVTPEGMGTAELALVDIEDIIYDDEIFMDEKFRQIRKIVNQYREKSPKLILNQ